MINLRLMRSREVREMQSFMFEEFGSVINGRFFVGSKGRVYLVTDDVVNVDLRSLNAEGVGVYIGRVNPDGFRPSIEGVQLLRPVRNVFELSDGQLVDWLAGRRIVIDTNFNGYCAFSYHGEVIGPGKVAGGVVWNYIPKERRVSKFLGKFI